MASEAAECAAVTQRLLDDDRAVLAAAQRLRELDPSVAVLCGRGSSGHAAWWLRHLLSVELGWTVAIATPSLTTHYGRPPARAGMVFMVVSQSGQSPDLVQSTSAARAAGALTIAFVNAAESPVAAAANLVIPLQAGPERAVAATKSVVASAFAAAQLVAALTPSALSAALHRVPARLEAAFGLDWSPWGTALSSARAAFVAGRGPALGVAREIALKLGECLMLPALGYSTAEIRHGPRGAIAGDTPVLVLRQADETAAGTDQLVADLLAAGEPVFDIGGRLPWIGHDHPALDPLVMLAPAYRTIERAARAMGCNPDEPRHLKKVTETV
jgi:glucosamine--fructose-6-phosphate aminotransferase (isomerizing)